jgi:hypothetical protein
MNGFVLEAMGNHGVLNIFKFTLGKLCYFGSKVQKQRVCFHLFFPIGR